MKIASSNKQNFYITTLDNCECKDFTLRHKSQNRLSCKCVKTFECIKCSCKHQRDNIDQLKIEALEK